MKIKLRNFDEYHDLMSSSLIISFLSFFSIFACASILFYVAATWSLDFEPIRGVVLASLTQLWLWVKVEK